MIHAYGRPDPPVPRLLEALAARGHAVKPAAAGRPNGPATLVLAAGAELDEMAFGVLLGAWRTAPGARVLVLSAIGAHPDAKEKRLRRLWRIEESARASGVPALTLRLAPMIGPRSPLWLRLRSRPRLLGGGRQLLNPVAEEDVVETLDRACGGRVRWEGWYEVAGAEVFSLSDLARWAVEAGPRLPRGAGAWEPPLPELREHRLCEARPWLEHFGLASPPLRARAAGWER